MYIIFALAGILTKIKRVAKVKTRKWIFENYIKTKNSRETMKTIKKVVLAAAFVLLPTLSYAQTYEEKATICSVVQCNGKMEALGTPDQFGLWKPILTREGDTVQVLALEPGQSEYQSAVQNFWEYSVNDIILLHEGIYVLSLFPKMGGVSEIKVVEFTFEPEVPPAYKYSDEKSDEPVCESPAPGTKAEWSDTGMGC